MTLGAKLWLAFAVIVALLVLAGFIVMYFELRDFAHTMHCFDGCVKGD